MRVLAVIEEPEVARKILECLDLPARAPPLLPAPAASASHEIAPSAGEEPPWVFDQTPPEGDDTT
jgi:hypothetical protein